MPPGGTSRQRAAKDVVDVLNEISTLLNTGLDRTTLSLCVSLIENGTVIKELRREAKALDQSAGR
ncbi:mitotic-spindle organizing protein 1 [Sphaerosporella brunnea]|uniref:Mitotic-spindle organizing protein 1 n=1 Tax=Sphaerosporella brunnea TaxID=1250544 RepID=A0A5J5EZ99_9PEZI|nr:mitotic-spindle organizing protein 1 [Sphaerosporella brunnea]